MTKPIAGLTAAVALLAAALAGCAEERPPMSGLRDQPAPPAQGIPPNAPLRQPGGRP